MASFTEMLLAIKVMKYKELTATWPSHSIRKCQQTT